MKSATSPMTASSASKTPGSRCKLRTTTGGLRPPRTPRPGLEAHRGLPLLQEPRLVVGGPLAVVVHELDRRETRCAGGRSHVGARRAAVAELHVEIAGLLGDGPVDERLGGGEVLRLSTLDDADRAHLEAGVARDGEVDGVALALLVQDVVAPVRAANELTLDDERECARRGRDVLGDVGVAALHVRHRPFLVRVEPEDLRRDEDVAAAGQQRTWQDELLLPRRVEQVVPGRGLLAADLLRETVVVGNEAEDARVPAGPKAGRLFELCRDVLRVRRDVGLEQALL